MPELPEVETERRYLEAHARGQRLSGVRAPHPDILAGTSAATLGRKLKRHRIESTRRHGKHLFVGFDPEAWLAMHFGMTGSLSYYRHGASVPEYAAVVFLFEGGHDLAYVSRRRLGRIGLVDDPDEFIADRGLGPDALSLSVDQFRQRVCVGRSTVKSRLMDQSRIAGIGNEYSDEILFHAGVHPGRSATSLSDREVSGLYRSMRRVLEKAIAVGADPDRMSRSWLYPRRTKGASCPKCGGPVRTTKSSGPTAYYCPRCQPQR